MYLNIYTKHYILIYSLILKEISQYSLNVRLNVFLINQINNYMNIRYIHKMRKQRSTYLCIVQYIVLQIYPFTLHYYITVNLHSSHSS